MFDNNRRLAVLFHAIANLLAARRENPHRIRAYERAAEAILALDRDIGVIEQEGSLQSIPGVGKELASKIGEFLKTGTIQTYEHLHQPLPPAIEAWTALPGLSEPVVHDLYYRLRVRTLEDLEHLVRSHLLRTLPGVSVSEETLLAAIERLSPGPSQASPAVTPAEGP